MLLNQLGLRGDCVRPCIIGNDWLYAGYLDFDPIIRV